MATVKRLTYALIMIALLLAGQYTGEILYFAGFSVMLLMLIYSLISLFLTVSHFSFLQTLSKPDPIKGETVTLDISVYNDFWVPMPYIDIYYDTMDSLLDSRLRTDTIVLLPRSHAGISEELYTRFRGDWNVGLKKAVIHDMFGLFSIRLNLDDARKNYYKPLLLHVRPRVLDLVYLPLPSAMEELISPINTSQTEDPSTPAQVRKYRLGDSLRRIHWKLTARKREMVSKEYEMTSSSDFLIYLNAMALTDEGMARLESEDVLVECATAVVNYALKHGMSLSFVGHGQKRMEFSSRRNEDFPAAYQAISSLQFDGTYLFNDVLMNDLSAISHASGLVIISCEISRPTYDILILLRQSQLEITVVFVHPASENPAENEDVWNRQMINGLIDAGVHMIQLSSGEDIAQKAVFRQ